MPESGLGSYSTPVPVALGDVSAKASRCPSVHIHSRQENPVAIRRTVEHVFGTLKYWMGSTHFLMRRLPNVATEMSLQVLAYKLKRVMSILGMARTMKAVSSMAT
jgi:hypothetical protein